jgi:hypothetical protein
MPTGYLQIFHHEAEGLISSLSGMVMTAPPDGVSALHRCNLLTIVGAEMLIRPLDRPAKPCIMAR